MKSHWTRNISNYIDDCNKSDIAIILNGPPGCGKDTLAQRMTTAIPCGLYKREFKQLLYKETASYFGVNVDHLIFFATHRDLKDSVRIPAMNNMTAREALIHVSEEIIKPLYGEDYFGNAETEKVRQLQHDLNDRQFDIIYSDGGFMSEIKSLTKVFKIVMVVRLFRDGFVFNNDSRNYIYPEGIDGVQSCDLHLVSGEIDNAIHSLIAAYWSLKYRCK
ncbi:MAG: hypothetical protein EKE20_14640 [Candidatus Symbiopectobacterium sp. Dall1.0]|nr:hypothetical protein [Candidatus Symbiopectobacterium sp. Dall1.0]